MKIGNTTLKHGLMLAPLAGYTNAAFREICAQYGAEYTVSEMISAKAVCYGDKKTLVLARNSSSVPMGLQLFGAEPEFIAKAIKILTSEEYREGNSSILPAAFDINMGCPVHKIVSNGEGSALMRDPERAAEIVRAAVGASPLPVTVKIRAGYSESERNAPEVARLLEEAGAALVCVHGRTRTQMYSGTVDRDIIREVKRAVSVPVIANVGNPWIFEQIIARLEGSEPREVSASERAQTAKRHLLSMCDLMGERRAVPEARKAVCAYFCDFSGAAAARAEINCASDADRMCRIIDRILK